MGHSAREKNVAYLLDALEETIAAEGYTPAERAAV